MSRRTRGRAQTVAPAARPKGVVALKITSNHQSLQEINPSGTTHSYQDHSSEQLMNANHKELAERDEGDDEEEEEDDQDDERHQLIARVDHTSLMRAAGRPVAAANGHRKRQAKDNGKHHHDHHQDQQQVMFVQDNNNNMARKFLGLFAPAFVTLANNSHKPQNHATGLHEHTADFVYQSNWDDELEDERRLGGSKPTGAGARYTRAYQSNDDVNLPSSYYLKPGGSSSPPPSGSHWASMSTMTGRRRRRAISFGLIILLLASVCLLLVLKLSELIMDERSRLIGGGGDESNGEPSQTRQELVDQLTKELDERHKQELELDRLARWLVSSPKCHIPVLEPWDESIKGYVGLEQPMNCSKILSEYSPAKNTTNKGPDLWMKSLSYVESNRLYFTEQALQLGAISTPTSDGECCMKRVSRVVDNDNDLELSRCEPIPGQGLQVLHPIVEINCASWNYTNVHSFIVHKEEEEQALAKVASERLSPDEDYYSVLLVGMDTISRLNGYRQLSKTLKTLKDLYNTLEFVGYNKVGENTFPNLIPLLTGLKPEQLAQVECWNSKSYSDENESGDDYLDNCKFLWNYYQKIGYITYFSEDWPGASTFNYLKQGFKYEPTNFYGRPFTLAREKLVYPKFDSLACASCQLDKPLVEVDIENLKGFLENNSNKLPYFAFHWFNCPQHDDLNGASQIDHLLEKFFKDMREQLESDRTFVVFFSDHGFRWNNFVSTRMGHYESSLPLLTIAPPKAFIERHPDMYENLKSHQNALITPFDLFKTFIDLKNLSSRTSGNTRDKRQSLENRTREESREESPNKNETLDESNPASYSVDTTTTIKQLKFDDGTTFKQKFNSFSLFESHSLDQLDRGCIEAGIPDNYCVCQQFEPVSINRADVIGAAYYLVYVHFEALVKNHLDICHRLDLDRVHHAEMFYLGTTTSTQNKTNARRRRRKNNKAVVVNDSEKLYRKQEEEYGISSNFLSSPKPIFAKHRHGANDDDNQNKHDHLPSREYSLILSTSPGGGLFQEVVRYYGTNMTECKLEIGKTRKVIEDEWAEAEDKIDSVLTMNEVCNFSAHSASVSRLNLYKNQSKCVKSNIELRKICYCNS